MIDQNILLRARALLEDVTPQLADCGKLCGAACCQSDEDGLGGMFLFPGEESLIGDADWAHIAPNRALGGCKLLTCEGRCDREQRPLACRIFPLTPTALKNGGFGVRIDRRSFAVCPLAVGGLPGLDPQFVHAVRDAISLIATDPAGASFLRAYAKLERQFASIVPF